MKPKNAHSAAATTAICALALVVTATAVARAHADEDGTASVRLEVSALRNASGTLNCRLFAEAASFPDGEGVSTLRAVISGLQSSCVFGDLQPGTYSVAVVHDENGNGRLDKNFVGIPTEGYGVSNNRTYAMTNPKWDESHFTITAGKPLVLHINLRY